MASGSRPVDPKAPLTEEQRIERLQTATEAELEAELCRLSLHEFVRAFWPVIESQPFTDGWHIEQICRHLEAVTRGDIKRLVINIPPGTGKSIVVSVMWPVWSWATNPSLRYFCASYDHKLSIRDNVRSRALIESDKYRRMYGSRYTIVKGQDLKTNYETDHGGYRLATSVGGHATGQHPDVILCFPYETSIITEEGVRSIGDLVSDGRAVRVLSFDHRTGRSEWCQVEEFERRSGRVTCRVFFSDHSSLECTEDHPIYVVGEGYISARRLRHGDEVVCVEELHRLRGGVQDEAVAGCRLLQLPVLQRDEAATEHDPVSGVRHGRVQGEGTSGEDGEAGSFLLTRVPRRVHQGRKPPPLQGAGGQGVQDLREGVPGGEAAGGHVGLLQRHLPHGGDTGGPAEEEAAASGGVRFLRGGYFSLPLFGGQEVVLLAELRQQGSFQADDGAGESQLHRRDESGRVHQGVREAQEERAGEGGLLLLPLQEAGGGERAGFRHSSHRRGEDERRSGEPRGSVQGVSRQAQRVQGETPRHGPKFVTHVKREVRIPDEVYNLRVEKNHNYFADGVLVHNCDDIQNAEQAESELEREAVARWWDLTLSSRGMVRDVRRVIVMQRLHVRDMTAHVLAKGDYEHLMLPMRFEPDRACYTSLGRVDPRTEEGELLIPELFTEAIVCDLEKSLGEYGSAGQLQQRPSPKGGGMFKVHFFNNRVRAAPYDCTRIRFTDRAATSEGGCYSASVLMAKSNTDPPLFYVEHVFRGQWEPRERNQRIIAAAHRDRAKYGAHEPVHVIEAERGSTGLESFQNLAAMMAGFRVKEDIPSGSKDTRAEPWADQLAAGNVFLVDDGTWPINDYIEEHLGFRPEPGKRVGGYKDMVDASSGAFNLLAGTKRTSGIRVVTFAATRKQTFKVVVCDSDQLLGLVLDHHHALLLSLDDPEPLGTDSLPDHGLTRLLDSYKLRFAAIQPADYQDRWEEPVEAYGRLPADLIMTRDHGKRLWTFLLRKRPNYAGVYVIHDDNADRALSVACGVCDGLGYRKQDTIFCAGLPSLVEKAPLQYVYEVVRASRSMVVG